MRADVLEVFWLPAADADHPLRASRATFEPTSRVLAGRGEDYVCGWLNKDCWLAASDVSAITAVPMPPAAVTRLPAI
jgi:hypothetical protein